MALPSILRGNAPSRVDNAAEMAAVLTALRSLSAQVNALTLEVNALKSAPSAVISTVGPVPESVDAIKSGRSGMRYIALRLGGKANEDTVRKCLTTSPAFAALREKAPDLTTNVPLIRWLAQEFDGRLAYVWIASGACSIPELMAAMQEARA